MSVFAAALAAASSTCRRLPRATTSLSTSTPPADLRASSQVSPNWYPNCSDPK